MSGESTVMPPRKLHDADVVYLYDGSFEGFLCCVFESFCLLYTSDAADDAVSV